MITERSRPWGTKAISLTSWQKQLARFESNWQ